MSRIAAISAGVAVVALLGGVYLAGFGGASDQFADCRTGAVAGGTTQIGGPFELLNAQGETVTDADVITGPSLIYFGYTFCPDVCPLDTYRNAEAVDLLEAQGHMVTPIFISIDPTRDTPQVVGEFAANLHDRMIGLTGSPEQVSAASKAYRTYYKAHDAEDEFYLVDHSTFTYLVLPEHGFVEFFRREVSPQEMADRVACFVDAA
ncbi:SCO family protein [Thalassococcus sp. CAU 1522]|uniref:SCO family protein n=1 Tax=Thalassococcus arenae TaxID=2851652 RepID=A0ABS6N675_9RHOB|nr:SCO family protein [Thalassococcus arenae]MBV2359511.1 SCO family protein [Thalassococcus arenae]